MELELTEREIKRLELTLHNDAARVSNWLRLAELERETPLVIERLRAGWEQSVSLLCKVSRAINESSNPASGHRHKSEENY
jgi:hypothetical protein